MMLEITAELATSCLEIHGLRGTDMNSPAVSLFAPSTRPALELIALAQLSPEQARKKLRALLLTNPNHFGKIPASSFNAVLKIQEDTTYECISRTGYDPGCEQFCALIEIKQTLGYSSDAVIHGTDKRGSEEFVRFYLSYDGGSNWLDQGMRSVNVCDSHLSRPAVYEVNLLIVLAEDSHGVKFPPKVRAILSWNSAPPAGAPNWTPVWGNVVESDIEIMDSPGDIPGRLHSGDNLGTSKLSLPVMTRITETNGGALTGKGHLQSPARHSTMTDPEHRFLAFVLARAAGFFTSGSRGSRTNEVDLIERDERARGFQLSSSAESTFSAVL